MCPKEAKAAIISAKFSNMGGDFLAISYNNEYKPQEAAAGEKKNEKVKNPLEY